MKNLILAIALMGMGSQAIASGFQCTGEDFNVKLFNHRSPEVGTRVPAALIISSLEDGTLLTATEEEISKSNRAHTVQYTVDGNEQLGAEKAILQIAFKEGAEVIQAGQAVRGYLILVQDGERNVYDLTCTRYKVRS